MRSERRDLTVAELEQVSGGTSNLILTVAGIIKEYAPTPPAPGGPGNWHGGEYAMDQLTQLPNR